MDSVGHSFSFSCSFKGSGFVYGSPIIKCLQNGVRLDQMYLMEFVPKRDSELVFGGMNVSRIDGMALMFLQATLIKGLSGDPKRTVGRTLE